MAQLLGDRLLPETVVSRRRQFRERVRDVRRPLRQFRERNVPGPDIVGTAEDRLTDLRNRVISRDSVLSRIRSRRSGGSDGSSGDGSSGGGSGSQQSNSINQMT